MSKFNRCSVQKESGYPFPICPHSSPTGVKVIPHDGVAYILQMNSNLVRPYRFGKKLKQKLEHQEILKTPVVPAVNAACLVQRILREFAVP